MTFDPLKAEHDAARDNAIQERRAFAKSPDARFARAMREAMTDYRKARDAGVSHEDGCKGIEAVLRDVWPRKVSKFQPACSICDDIGREIRTCCHAMRCGRKGCEDAHPADEHTYAVTCSCPAGDKFRPRQRSGDEDVASVGRTYKRRNSGFSRF